MSGSILCSFFFYDPSLIIGQDQMAIMLTAVTCMPVNNILHLGHQNDICFEHS